MTGRRGDSCFLDEAERQTPIRQRRRLCRGGVVGTRWEWGQLHWLKSAVVAHRDRVAGEVLDLEAQQSGAGDRGLELVDSRLSRSGIVLQRRRRIVSTLSRLARAE